MISLNLALINILPFPALDGGRVLFVLIETITRRKLPPSFVFWVNTGAFILLIGLMVIISIKDVIHLF
jgi:regulator of sigma E protease